MRILEELWYGNISPAERNGATSRRDKAHAAQLERHQSKLLANLSSEQTALYNNVHDVWLEIQQHAECDAFVTGFSLAVRMMSEATSGKEIIHS